MALLQGLLQTALDASKCLPVLDDLRIQRLDVAAQPTENHDRHQQAKNGPDAANPLSTPRFARPRGLRRLSNVAPLSTPRRAHHAIRFAGQADSANPFSSFRRKLESCQLPGKLPLVFITRSEFLRPAVWMPFSLNLRNAPKKSAMTIAVMDVIGATIKAMATATLSILNPDGIHIANPSTANKTSTTKIPTSTATCFMTTLTRISCVTALA